MKHEIVTDLNSWKLSIYSEFIIILTQAPCDIIGILTRFILLAKHSDMVIRSIHRRAHKIHCTCIQANIFLISVLFVDRLRNQVPIRSKHISSKLCIDRDISHTCWNKDLLKCLPYTLTDRHNIIGLLIQSVWHSHAAGQIDKRYMHPRLFGKLHGSLKQQLCKCWIIIIRHCITRQERMYSHMLHTLCLEL